MINYLKQLCCLIFLWNPDKLFQGFFDEYKVQKNDIHLKQTYFVTKCLNGSLKLICHCW